MALLSVCDLVTEQAGNTQGPHTKSLLHLHTSFLVQLASLRWFLIAFAVDALDLIEALLPEPELHVHLFTATGPGL